MRNKSDLYKEQQILIVDKLINILDLDKDNGITLYDLDNNKDINEKIMNLIPEIKKYFRIDSIHGIRNTKNIKRPYLSIIRNITKIKYNILLTDFRKELNNTKIRTTKYIFLEKI
jgi:hypothetical protein